MATTVDNRREIENLEARLEHTRAQLRDLATMGAVITSIRELDKLLSVIMDMALRIIDGEVGLIMLAEGGQLESKISWGVDAEFIKSLKYDDGLDLAAYSFTHREPVIINDLNTRTDTGITLKSVIAHPIKTVDKCHGVVVLINRANGGQFDDEDAETLSLLMDFVAVALDNANLIKARIRQAKVDQEMAIAKQIQETILPQDIADIPGVDIGAVYFPAREVSGDFYDVIRTDPDRFLVILGDVSNKGVPASLVMSATSGIIRSIMQSEPHIGVSELAGRVNNLLAREIIRDREMFVTMFFCRFDLRAHELCYCNAGHLPGMLWKHETHRIEDLSAGGSIVGQFEDMAFAQETRALDSGDRLFLFTDGLTEATDRHGNLFGRERAEQVFSVEIGLPPGEFCPKVKQWVDQFAEGSPPDNKDDFTIMQIKVE